MNPRRKLVLTILICMSFGMSSYAQLSNQRIADIADIKVERFQKILDLSSPQAEQMKKQTVSLLKAQSIVDSSNEIVKQINTNLENYYKSLTAFTPQQLNTLKLFDSLDRSGRKEAYKDLMNVYGQSSEFAVAVAGYNWNIAIPILTSYRKDLDRYISPSDRAVITDIRNEMLSKYNFIVTARDHNPSVETESIVSEIQDQLLMDIQDSEIPRLLKKYDDKIINIRTSMQSHESKINKDIKKIYDDYVLENHQMQMKKESELLSTLGISKLLRDSFFLLMDGDSRTASFKINALNLMANQMQVVDQF